LLIIEQSKEGDECWAERRCPDLMG
jgi:hypothetical protein